MNETTGARKVREAGIFTPGLLKELLQCRILQLHGQKDPKAAFDHVLHWGESEEERFCQLRHNRALRTVGVELGRKRPTAL